MYVGNDFDPSDVGEIENYGFDFTAILGVGETIVSATWVCSVVNGTDPSPSSRLYGTPINTTTITTQKISTLLGGVQYRLQAIATTSFGQVLSLWSHVTCNVPS